MAGLTPLPPHILHNSTRLTHAQAQAHLSTFLSNAENDAAYRPDSTLTERGPQSASTGANPNLTLHHLRRILQGIEGKRIGGRDVGRLFGEGAKHGNPLPCKRKSEDTDDGGRPRRKQVQDTNPEDENKGPGVEIEGEADGWQDKDDYDRAQEDNGIDTLGEERHPGAHLEEPANSEEAEDMAGIEIANSGRKVGLSEQHAEDTTTDKNAKKAAKKARVAQQKREKEEAKARAKAER